jgi:drug/metabolite transporter (DMT)-like permease
VRPSRLSAFLLLPLGANAVGFTVQLLPAFGTVLAIPFVGESFAAFHAAGIATILAWVILATRARG